jgi:DNA-directed RNA polymerase specialized sigma24 family protein
MDDDELIAAIAGGGDTALRELFSRHAPWLAARLRKALPPDDVEDVLQETCLGSRSRDRRGCVVLTCSFAVFVWGICALL